MGLSGRRRTAAIIGAALVVVALIALSVWRYPRPIPIVSADTVVVYSPHPDDETYAMGQAVAEQAIAGKRVVGVLLTDGEDSIQVPDWIESSDARDADDDGDIDKWDYALLRRQEYVAAMESLGADELVFLGAADSQGQDGLRDASLDLEEVTETLTSIDLIEKDIAGPLAHFTTAPFNEREYRIVGDARLHPDHTVVADAVLALAEERGEETGFFKVYVYVYDRWWKRWAPRIVQGSPEAQERKHDAIDAYADMGRTSTLEIWEAAGESTVEYMVPSWFY